MQKSQEISTVAISTSVNKGDWVFGARGLSVSVSEDGKEYTEVYNESLPEMKESDPDQIYNHKMDFMPVTARYVKVKALVEHKMPKWHGAAGKGSFLFVDEVEIN